MDSYEFTVCVQRRDDIWTYTVAQEFNEEEVEILALGFGETPEEAIELAMLEMKTFV